MKHLFQLPLYLLTVSAIIFSSCSSGDSKTSTALPGLITALQAKIPPENTKAFEEVIKEKAEDPDVMRFLGLYAYMNRELETAAWCFARAAEKSPNDYVNLSNLGLCLEELSGMEGADSIYSQVSLDFLHRAADGAPGIAEPNNNLGHALYNRYRQSRDMALLEEAEKYLRKAMTINPGNAITLSHLSEVLAELNKKEEAISILNKVHRSEPYNAVFAAAVTQLGNDYISANAERTYCDSINFHCNENCPHSIIGRLQFVTCEMEQSSNILACRDGRPYITSYNCDEEIGDVPFLIPGLNSGVCILTPFGKLCIMLQGGGKVDFKLDIQGLPKMPDGLKFSTEGRYDPKGGQSRINFNTSVSVNVFNRNEAAQILNMLDVGPLAVKVEAKPSPGNSPLQVEVYGKPFSVPIMN